MSDSWPPLDTHAHVDPTIERTELLAVRSVIFAATRTVAEFEATRGRDDPVTVWGVGAHPGLPSAVDGFSSDAFRSALRPTPLVSEVGMDGRSPVSRTHQRNVFDEILAVLVDEPRIVSVHSAGAAAGVLDALENRPVSGVILHWWRGDVGETARAVELGCYFSINPAELGRPAVIGRVPWDRILPETDHPYGDRREKAAPGRVDRVEDAVAKKMGVSAEWVRRGMWGNVARLVDVTGTFDLFGDRIRQMLSVAPAPLGPAPPP